MRARRRTFTKNLKWFRSSPVPPYSLLHGCLPFDFDTKLIRMRS